MIAHTLIDNTPNMQPITKNSNLFELVSYQKITKVQEETTWQQKVILAPFVATRIVQ